MRISDWSSDVCSSDLEIIRRAARRYVDRAAGRIAPIKRALRSTQHLDLLDIVEARKRDDRARYKHPVDMEGDAALGRSEEHTSELQSLMRTSYAVFCLKKKNKTNHRNNTLDTSTDIVQATSTNDTQKQETNK